MDYSVNLPGELDTTLYDDMVEYFGTTADEDEGPTRNDLIVAEWDDYGYMYDMVL